MKGRPSLTHTPRTPLGVCESALPRVPVNARETAYAVTLTDTGQSDIPAIIRLRRFLKAALRAYGFRCTDIHQTNQPKDKQ